MSYRNVFSCAPFCVMAGFGKEKAVNNKDQKRHLAYEALVILCLLALFNFICRLWPILLLIILGIFIAALRLLFLSSRKVEVSEPLPLLPESVKETTAQDVQALAYAVILRRITELVMSQYPDARWVWEMPDAQKRLQEDQEVFILLNRAGGYRRARVLVSNLRVTGLEYLSAPQPPESFNAEFELDEPEAQNYELLAFEWVDTHILELNSRCNEAIGEYLSELTLLAEELPVRESWPDICRELMRSGLEEAKCLPEGIRINLTQ